MSPSGEYHLLLGRERFLPQWKGSCRWSGFEGSRKPSESLLEAAVREFTEESLGVVFESVEEITNYIKQKDYWLRVVLRILNDRRAERYHSTYVVNVPWNGDMSERFAKQRSNIERLDRLTREMERAFPTFALINGQEVELGDVVILDNGWLKLYRYVGEEAESDIAEGTRGGFMTRCMEQQEEDVSDEDDEDRVTWTVDESCKDGLEVLTLSPEHPYSARIKAWEAIRKRLESDDLSHPSVITRVGSKVGRLQDMRVHTDHLEKDQIRWWSSTDLRRVLDLRGYLGNDCFRPYFLPVLQTVLHELSNLPPNAFVGKANSEEGGEEGGARTGRESQVNADVESCTDSRAKEKVGVDEKTPSQ